MLSELCVRYGYCNDLDPAAIATMQSAGEVVDAVLVAEGNDPSRCDRKTRDGLIRVVDDWLFSPGGRGAKSGLPR